jgi:hypothetical protein
LIISSAFGDGGPYNDDLGTTTGGSGKEGKTNAENGV